MDCFSPPLIRVTLISLALQVGVSGCAKNNALEQAFAAANTETTLRDDDNANVNNRILALIADQKGANKMTKDKPQSRKLILKNTDPGFSPEHEFILNTFIKLNPIPHDYLASLHVPTGKGNFVLLGTRLRHARQITDLLAKHEIWAEIQLDPDLPEDQILLVMTSIFDRSVTPQENKHNER